MIPEGAFRFVRAQRLNRKFLSRLGLIALIGTTSAAMGWSIGWWLVPFYWLAMYGLIVGAVGSANPHESTPLVVEAERSESAPESAAPGAPAASDVPTEAAKSEPTESTKARKRTRKPKAPKAVEKVVEIEPTWIQVAPGKFVRVEVPQPTPSENGAVSEEPAQAQVLPEPIPPGESEATGVLEVTQPDSSEESGFVDIPASEMVQEVELAPTRGDAGAARGALDVARAHSDPDAGRPLLVPFASRRPIRTSCQNGFARRSRAPSRARRGARVPLRLASPVVARAQKGNRRLWPGRNRSARIR